MKYEKPIMELIKFEAKDIVTISGTEGDGGQFDPNALNPAWVSE